MTPQQLIDTYLAELRRTVGDACADNVRLVYNPRGGWYHLRTPYKTGRDSYTPSGVGKNYRRAKLEKAIEILRTRTRQDYEE